MCVACVSLCCSSRCPGRLPAGAPAGRPWAAPAAAAGPAPPRAASWAAAPRRGGATKAGAGGWATCMLDDAGAIGATATVAAAVAAVLSAGTTTAAGDCHLHVCCSPCISFGTGALPVRTMRPGCDESLLMLLPLLAARQPPRNIGTAASVRGVPAHGLALRGATEPTSRLYRSRIRGPSEYARRSARFCLEDAVSASSDVRPVLGRASTERAEPVGDGLRSRRPPLLLLEARTPVLPPLPSPRATVVLRPRCWPSREARARPRARRSLPVCSDNGMTIRRTPSCWILP
mmetsp:Transcript_96774/g.300957  ORF Transcript_96774/g.300957 Transcript_96774/m.300957 type:complete len:289 (+) Transcript_96774:602-1468(+)